MPTKKVAVKTTRRKFITAQKLSVVRRYSLRLALSSAWTRIRMKFWPLPLQRHLQKIDVAEIEAIRQRCYENKESGASTQGLKYLNFRKYLPVNMRRVQELGLDKAAPKRILDLGSGAGYFLFACKNFGHDCLGLDTDYVPAYAEMMQVMEIPRVTWRIEPFEALPEMDAKFDLITAFQMLFNRRQPSGRWEAAEWDFFLRDLLSRLQPNGSIFLRFNLEHKDCYITQELAEFFRARGGVVRRTSVHFDLSNAATKAKMTAAMA